MTTNVYSIFDKAAGTWFDVFCLPNNAVLFRKLQDEVARPDSQFRKHHADYDVFLVGAFDTREGMIEAFSHERVCGMSDLVDDQQKGGSDGV